ncbi:hypothetical protein ABW20_dc0104827 [Dactylellina cionopaga]|nr:hypothetical protein ABW20_dc0104827 [Dactylellina cionopaga]
MVISSRRRPRLVGGACVLVAVAIITVPVFYFPGSAVKYLPVCRTPGPKFEDSASLERSQKSSTSQISTFSPSPTPSSAPSSTPTPLSVLELPSEYKLSSDQEMCEKMYGRGYFTHIEENQAPYCEPPSSSFLQCFSAPRLPQPWISEWSSATGDPFCIARGVYFNTTSNDKKYFKAHCIGPPNRQVFAEYWGGSGVGGEFKAHWDLGTQIADCSKDSNNGEWLFVVKREESSNIWHNLMSLWQALITLDAMQITRNPATGRPWLTKENIASMQIVFDDDLPTQDLEDWWRMLNGKIPIKVNSLKNDACYGNVLLPLPGSSSPFWAALTETVYHEPCQSSILIDAFRRRVFQHLQIEPRPLNREPNEHPSIIFINRMATRKLWNADALMGKVRERYPKSKVTVADFATLSLHDQVALVAESDVLIGHFGAGLAHLLFLPLGAACVDITSSPARKFRSITRMRSIARFEATCLEEPEYNHIVNGTSLPPGWRPGMNDANWQTREYAYVVEEDFLAWVDAAVRNQLNQRYTRAPWGG